ncbi:unnamed protein product [Lathyrus oleraceus]|uniref:Late embryogenesis abundant protein LEA-2 subgroup domain-containing protein n=1 Tax=Pisum sativum TaxID=3888 RepID=A0A9D4YLR5_PEA|nr:uncharacterized protein LOC127116377 [Pisum sativum]KAI5441868.1 hypothetical protein KIW84_011069 [Pisum sativum]
MTGKDEFVSYSPLPSNPNPNPYSYPYPQQNVVVLLPSYRPRSRHHHHRTCLIYSAALLLTLLIAAGIFILYPSDPEIRLVRIRINHIGIRTNPKPILDLSFSLTVKVRNRDFFSLTYDSLVVSVGYRGRQLGLVSSVGGARIKARGSSYVDVVLSVDGFEVIYDAFYLLQDIAKGVIPLETDTRVDGKLGLLFFDVPLKATVSCAVYVNLNKQTVVRQDCYPESLGDTLDRNISIAAGETP